MIPPPWLSVPVSGILCGTVVFYLILLFSLLGDADLRLRLRKLALPAAAVAGLIVAGMVWWAMVG